MLWADEVPKFSLLWLSEPDLTEHETELGAPAAMAAIRSSDNNLAQVIAALKRKNVLAKTDVFVVSDHGFSTIYHVADVAEQLRQRGFQTRCALLVKSRSAGRYWSFRSVEASRSTSSITNRP